LFTGWDVFATSLDMFVHVGKTTTETYQLLQQAYGEDAMGCTQVFDWFLQFKDGRNSVESDRHSGRPSKVMY